MKIYEALSMGKALVSTTIGAEGLPTYNGTIVHWESFEAGDNNWTIIPNTTNTYSVDFDFVRNHDAIAYGINFGYSF